MKDVGLVYPRREGATTPLWRGRKGLAYCFATDRADLQSRGYDELEVAGYVWPLG